MIQLEGFAGYGRWMRLLEIIAFKMDGTNRCYVEYSYSKWRDLLGLNKNKLNYFLTILEDKLNIKSTINRNIVKIEIPNLLKKRDNYTKDLQVSSKLLPSKKKKENKNKNKDYSPTSDEVVISGLLLSKILERDEKHKKPDIQKWAIHINRLIHIDNRNPNEIKSVVIWCQADNFWQNNILSTEKLRKQYGQLKIKMESGGQHDKGPGFTKSGGIRGKPGKYANTAKTPNRD